MPFEKKAKSYPPLYAEDGKRIYRLGECGSKHPRKIAIQDYKSIRNRCVSNGVLFEDPEFKPYSIWINDAKDKSVEWRRPSEIVKHPKMFVGDYSRFDIKQGLLGDCWFLAGLGALIMNRGLLCQVIPRGQNFSKKYAGIFRFRLNQFFWHLDDNDPTKWFWQYGRWVEVVIDDRLPVVEGRLRYVHSRRKDVFWSALLEKAYAKLHGSYKALVGGNACESLLDFTGGISETYYGSDITDDFFKDLLQAFERDSLICASVIASPGDFKDDDDDDKVSGEVCYDQSTEDDFSFDIITSDDEDYDEDDEETDEGVVEDDECDDLYADEYSDLFKIKYKNMIRSDGIVTCHAYSVTHVCYVTINKSGIEEKVPLVRIRNPWGMDIEWSGRWSEGSSEWELVSEEERAKLNLVIDSDGEFWMHYDDFHKSFPLVSLCHWKTENFTTENDKFQNKTAWEVSAIDGELTKSPDVVLTAKEDIWSILTKFPPHILQVVDPDENDDDLLCTVVVSMQLKYARILASRKNIIFYMFKQSPDDPCPLTSTFFKTCQVLSKTKYFGLRECTVRMRVPPGNYYIIPFTMDLDYTKIEYLLRVFTEKPSIVITNDGENKMIDIDERVKNVHIEKPKLRAEKISWQELKRILDNFIEPHEDQGFSRDTCRSIIAILDKEHVGYINHKEFKTFWKDVCKWRAVFGIYDTNGEGCIPTYNLQKVLKSAGFELYREIYNMIASRYSNTEEGSVVIEDFIVCVFRLQKMFSAYNAKLQDGENNITLTCKEWLESNII